MSNEILSKYRHGNPIRINASALNLVIESCADKMILTFSSEGEGKKKSSIQKRPTHPAKIDPQIEEFELASTYIIIANEMCPPIVQQ